MEHSIASQVLMSSRRQILPLGSTSLQAQIQVIILQTFGNGLAFEFFTIRSNFTF